jgi:tetratricopeptide (TPR) repeat protein
MAIPKSSSAARRHVGRQSALKLFTDREQEREMLRHFFERLARVDRVREVRPEKPILSIWGVGGIGKTKLLEKATEELGHSLAGLRLISLDLDHDRWAPSSAVTEFFWHLRSQLWKVKARGTSGGVSIETPLFDYLYFALWRAQHPGENFALTDSVLKDLLSTSTQGTNILAEASVKLASGVSDAATASNAVGGLFQFLGKGLALLRKRARKGLLNERGLNPESMGEKEMEAELAPMLAADVEQWLEGHPNDSLCIAIDGFERIQSATLAEDIQKYLADWCGILTDPDAAFSGRFGCLFLGRNKNRWDELYDKEWQERISKHRVGGLGEEDARKFLEFAAADHENRGDRTTAGNLRKHADVILAGTREHRSAEGPTFFHPYYLDLAYGILYDRGVHFLPDDLGQTPAELQMRFLRHLQIGQPVVFDAFRCLALAGSFDKALFKHLVEQGCITPGIQFAAITGEDYSYVEGISDMPGTFRFHRMMELALIKNQSAKAEDRAVAWQRIDVILSYFKAKAVFSKLADCSDLNLSAYQKGMTVAFDRYNDGFLDLSTLQTFFNDLNEPFDFKAYVNVRIGWWSTFCELQQRHHPKEHPDVAINLNNLALLYRAQGHYGKAEPLYQQALMIREKALGPEHPDVATSLNNLAELHVSQCQYDKAESLYQRALMIREKAFGLDHPAVAISLNNLAALYHTVSQYGKAEPLYQRALMIREKAFGLDHPDVANSLNNLAQLSQAQGQYGRAEPLLERALAISENVLGPEHPHTLINVHNLATLYRVQGKYAKAEPIYERTLVNFEKALGVDHPDVGKSLNNLASLYLTQGKYAKAGPIYRRALAILEKALGADHPDLATSLNDLAGLCQDQGQYAEAEPLYQRALAIWEKALGPEHPNVATSLNNLAMLYDNQGQYAKAEPLYQRALAISEKSLGSTHPNVATSLNNLAMLYGNQGQYAKAEPLHQRALAIWEKALGPDHPDVATSLNNLATLYDKQSQYAKAEPLFERALVILEKTLGSEHPNVETCLRNYAFLLRDMGRPEEAEPLETRAKAIRLRTPE